MNNEIIKILNINIYHDCKDLYYIRLLTDLEKRIKGLEGNTPQQLLYPKSRMPHCSSLCLSNNLFGQFTDFYVALFTGMSDCHSFCPLPVVCNIFSFFLKT